MQLEETDETRRGLKSASALGRHTRVSKHREWVSWMVVFALLMLSFVLWTVLREREDSRLFDQQFQRAETMETVLQHRLSSIDEPLYWNSYLFQAQGAVNRTMFENFNAHLLQRAPSLWALQWTPRVWARERSAFIQATRLEGYSGFEILEPNAQGQLVAANDHRDFYLPVHYAVSKSGMNTAMGLNTGFNPARQDWYVQSARSGSPITTGVIPLFDSRSGGSHPGLVHSRPVYFQGEPYDPEKRWMHLRGWVEAIVSAEELFANTIDKNLTPEFDVIIFERSPRGDFVIGQRSLAGEKAASLPTSAYRMQKNDFVKTMALGTMAWGIALRPTPVWYANVSHTQSTASLLAGLGFALLVGLHFYWQAGQRRKAQCLQEKISAREVLLHDVTHDVPIAVYQAKTLVGLPPRITFTTDQVQHILGVSATEVMDDVANCFRHLKPGGSPHASLAHATLALGQNAQNAIYQLHINGVDRWVEHRARQRQANTQGTCVSTGYWADVTESILRERQLTEAKVALEASNQTLLKTVDELERTRSALLQSEKLASLGALVAGISHELNTPLGNALLASSGLKAQLQDTGKRLASGNLKKSQLERLFAEGAPTIDLVLRSVERAVDLVEKFKQMAVDQTTQQRRTFDVSTLLQATADSIQNRLSTPRWHFQKDIAPAITMDSFPLPLEQILQSLIANSLEHGFSGRSEGHILVSCHLEAATDQDATPQWVLVAIEDDGVGIPTQSIDRVFDPFFTTRMGRNIGIGLNMVHRIASNVLGGTVHVTSVPGKGTRFALRLPLLAPAII